MATVPFATGAERDEARFFFLMACAMSAAIVGGFSLSIVLGRSSFGMPWPVHVHGIVFMGWVGIYLAQNTLILQDNVALHRRLGWLAALWLPLMVGAGLLAVTLKMRTTGAVPFFDQNQFLFSAPLLLFAFVGLTVWAIVVRRNTGWHRRLMFCGFATLTGPGLGRLLPMPLFMPHTWWIGTVLIPLIFPLIGMLADKRRYGRIHPAWFWGVGLILGVQIVADLIAYSDWGIAFTERFVAGTPGAARPMEAFFPPM
jgi:hypothetical protein